MSWDNRPQVVESCIKPLEDRMKECLEHIRINDNLVLAFDEMMQRYGEYMLFEHGAERMYCKAVIEQKRLAAEWKRLKKEAKKKK